MLGSRRGSIDAQPMNLMERRQASWSKRNAANNSYPTLSQSTFEPYEPPRTQSRPQSLAQPNYLPFEAQRKDGVDTETGNFDISPDGDSSSFEPLPLANTPLAHTPLPQSDSNNSIETTTSRFTDARTDFSSPPLARSNGPSPLDELPPNSSSPQKSTGAPCSNSSSVLAAIADSPSRPPSVSRPPLPRKNSARNSLQDSRKTTISEGQNRSRANSEAVGGFKEQVIRKVPSFTMTPPAQRSNDVTPTPPTTALPTPPADLSYPRPRPPLASRTPALSQAGSTASSRFSLASENSSGLRNSELFQSPDMTEEGYSHRTSSVADSEWSSRIKSDSATPYSTDNEESVTNQPTPEINSTSINRSRSESRPVGIATLQLDTSSMEHHPSPPTGMPPTASLAGLGIGWEEGDLQSNLDELSRYAKTLPSPLPSPLPRQDVESPLDRWQGGEGGQNGRGLSSTEQGPNRLSLAPPVPPIPNLDASTAPPTPSNRPRARSRSASRNRQPTKKPSLVDLAASTSSSPYFGGRSGKVRTEPTPPLPQPTRRERERSSTHDSESYLSMDETDFLSTDDEEGSRSFGKMRFQSFAQSGDQSIGSLNDGASPNGYYGVGGGGGSNGTQSAGTLSPNGVTNFSNFATLRGTTATPDLDSSLWNSDLARLNGGDGEEGEKVIHGILDWSGKAIEMTEVPPTTTHLILARTSTPLLIAPLLNVTIPNLSHGLIVLDISSCGLTEVPLALASCTSLEELDIHGNHLATGTLPSFLGSLPSLLVLIADACGLTSLPSSLSHLNRLHTLAVRDNRLRALPSWFSRLSSLEVLLIDGNPLHWQYQNLVRPLLAAFTDSPEQMQQAPVRQTASPLPSNLGPTSQSLPGSRARSPSGTYPSSSNNSSFSIPPSLGVSPSVANFPSSAPPQQSSFSELSIPSPTSRDGDEPLPSPATIVPSPDPSSRAQTPSEFNNSSEGGGGPKKSWGRLFKKVSTSRMNLKRPGALETDSRTFSEPVTRAEGSQAEEKSGGLFGTRKTFRKKSSKPPVPQALSVLTDPSTPNSAKRRSFLVLDAFKSPSDSGSIRQLPSPTPQNHQVALRSVLAYLRDLDDLSEDLSLPNIPLDTPSPPLRHSPSLGNLSPTPPRVDSPDVRRAQSTRRPFPSRSPRPGSSSRLSEYYEDSNDSSSGGRATPLPGGTFSPLPGTAGASTDQIKLKNDPTRREAVLKEIVETEQTYLRGLEELCAIYVASSAKTVSSNGGKKDPVLPLAERRAVFSNIEAIRDFHRTIFLPDLLTAVGSGGDSTVVAGQVGEVFRQHGSFLKIYSAYVNGFDSALAQIQTWAASSTSGRPSTSSGTTSSSTMFDAASQIGSTLTQSQKKRIKSWMKRCRAHPSHSQISLESYLLLPVQRIPRYRLLLESLLACTPSPPADSLAPPSAFSSLNSQLSPHPTILSAVLEMDLVATTLNESKRETEGRAQLLMWQGRIVNRYKSSLVQPHRTLLRSGKLVLTRSVKRSTTHLDALPPPTHYANGSARSRLGMGGVNDSIVDSNGPSIQNQGDEIHTLFTETSVQELIVLLCTDLLILVKAPPPPLDSDSNAPVELYTVVRLNSGAVEGGGQRKGSTGDGPVSLFGKDEDMLRIKVGTKAILYLQHPSAASTSTSQSPEEAASAKRKRKMEARQWRDAINLQFYINT